MDHNNKIIKIDRVIHEPVRLAIMNCLYEREFVDFNGLLEEFALTRGNLASHIKRLEQARYIEVIKTFRQRIPHTTYTLTTKGRQAYINYWDFIDEIRKNIVLGG